MSTQKPKYSVISIVVKVFFDSYIAALIMMMLASDNTITINATSFKWLLAALINVGFVVFMMSGITLLIQFKTNTAKFKEFLPEGYGLFWLTGFLIYANMLAGYTTYGIMIGVVLATNAYLRFWRVK